MCVLKPNQSYDIDELESNLKDLKERRITLHRITNEIKSEFITSMKTLSELKSDNTTEVTRASTVIQDMHKEFVADFVYSKFDRIIQKKSKLGLVKTPAPTRRRPEEHSAYFHAQLVSFVQALLASAYPSAPAVSFDARPPPVVKRSLAAPFPLVTCPALQTLFARVSHITGVAKTHPKVAAARVALEFADRVTLVRVALA